MEEDFDKDDLLGRWLGGSLSAQEEAALKQRADFAEYERLAREASELKIGHFDAQASLARLKAKREMGAAAGAKQGKEAKKEAIIRPLHLRPRLWLSIAAGLLLLLSIWTFWPQGTELYRAPVATTLEEVLPDDSSIRLNAATQLSFDNRGDQRLAQLEGEAFFDVAKDGRPFLVTTSIGQVEVLGTTFNVYSRNQEMRVSCLTGQVRVRFTDNAQAYTLAPGASVSITPDGTVSQEVIPDVESIDWLSGRSAFNDRPLAEVVAALERQFDLNIVVPAELDLQQRMQTTFPNGNADQALEIVFGALDQVRFQREGRVVTLTLPQ